MTRRRATSEHRAYYLVSFGTVAWLVEASDQFHARDAVCDNATVKTGVRLALRPADFQVRRATEVEVERSTITPRKGKPYVKCLHAR